MTAEEKNKLFELCEPRHMLVVFCPNGLLPVSFWGELDNLAGIENSHWHMTEFDPTIVSDIKEWIEENKQSGENTKSVLIDLQNLSQFYEKLSNFEKLCQLLLELDQLVQSYQDLHMMVAVRFDESYFAATMADAVLKYKAPKQSEHFTMLSMTATNPVQITIVNGEHTDETIEYDLYQNLPFSDFFKGCISQAVENEILKNQHSRTVFENLLHELKDSSPDNNFVKLGSQLAIKNFQASFDDIYDYITELNHDKELTNGEVKTLRQEIAKLHLENDSNELKELIKKTKTQLQPNLINIKELINNCKNGFERYIVNRAAMQK